VPGQRRGLEGGNGPCSEKKGGECQRRRTRVENGNYWQKGVGEERPPGHIRIERLWGRGNPDLKRINQEIKSQGRKGRPETNWRTIKEGKTNIGKIEELGLRSGKAFLIGREGGGGGKKKRKRPRRKEVPGKGMLS